MIACLAVPPRCRPGSLRWRTGGVEQGGACDALPLPGFEFADRGVKIGQRLADMALDIDFDAAGSDHVPAGALDLEDDQHLLAIVGDDREANSPSAARGQPPPAFPESRRAPLFLNKDLWTGDFSGDQYAAARKTHDRSPAETRRLSAALRDGCYARAVILL